jgi:hypothetical protein
MEEILMKEVYEKPELNEAMNGTLEGAYACWGFDWISWFSWEFEVDYQSCCSTPKKSENCWSSYDYGSYCHH